MIIIIHNIILHLMMQISERCKIQLNKNNVQSRNTEFFVECQSHTQKCSKWWITRFLGNGFYQIELLLQGRKQMINVATDTSVLMCKCPLQGICQLIEYIIIYTYFMCLWCHEHVRNTKLPVCEKKYFLVKLEQTAVKFL